MILNSKECALKSQGASRKQKHSTSQKLFEQVPQIIWSWQETSTYCCENTQGQYSTCSSTGPALPSTKDPRICWKVAIIPQLAVSALQATSPTPENSASLDIPE